MAKTQEELKNIVEELVAEIADKTSAFLAQHPQVPYKVAQSLVIKQMAEEKKAA